MVGGVSDVGVVWEGGCGLGVFCAKNIHNLFCHDHFPPCTIYDPVLYQN